MIDKPRPRFTGIFLFVAEIIIAQEKNVLQMYNYGPFNHSPYDFMLSVYYSF